VLPAFILGLWPFVARADGAWPTPEEVATKFLQHLEHSEVDEAMKLWAPGVANERVKARVRRMSAKIVALGGIKRIKTPLVEQRERYVESHEVVVVVAFNDGKSLAFGSISFVKQDGAYRISNLRSQKG